MSERTRALERSLRDGPPDESGYVARSFEPRIQVLDPGTTTAGRLERVTPDRRRRTPWAMALQPGIAAVLVVAIGISGLVLIVRPTVPGITGPAAVPVPTLRPSPTPTPGTSATPSPSPTPQPARTAGAGPTTASIPLPALSRTFVSPRNGFSVMYPAGWTVKQATTSWRPDTFLPLGNPALDDLEQPGIARLVVASHRLAAGQTEQQWLAAYQPIYQVNTSCRSTDPATWPRLAIGGQSGYLATAGCPVDGDLPGAPGQIEFDAFVFAGGRVYMIELLGQVDRPYFDAVIATFRLDPASAIDPSN